MQVDQEGPQPRPPLLQAPSSDAGTYDGIDGCYGGPKDSQTP